MKKVIFVLFVATAMLNGCKREPLLPPLPPDASVPTLSYPITSFATVRKFYAFGDTAVGNPANKGYEIVLSDTNTRFLAACPGIVAAITHNPNGTSNILINYKSNSPYSFLYGGVRNVQVNLNDTVVAGAVLGNISTIIDFSFIKDNNRVFCPATFGSHDFNTSIQVAMRLSNMANPEDTIASPCNSDSMNF